MPVATADPSTTSAEPAEPDPATATICEAAALPVERLEAEITSLAGHLAAGMCRWLLLVAEFDRREGWLTWECQSCAHWLMWQCGESLRTAQDKVRVAHALASLPKIRAEFAAGRLSYSKVRAISRVAAERTEDFFVEFARNATTSQLERLVNSYRRTGKLDDDTARRRHDRRSFRWWIDDDGMVCFQGRLSPEDAAVVTSAITAATVPPTRRDAERPTTADGRTIPQPGDDPLHARQADALVAICAGTTDTSPATVIVHVDQDTLDHDADGACHIDGSANLTPETARRLACDATTYDVIERDGEPVTTTKASRSIPPRLRRQLTARDHGCCRIPGCGRSGQVHAHHLIHRAHHGPNALDNLLTLCPFHHRLVHEAGYRVELLLDQVIVHRPGRPPLTDTNPAPPSGPDLPTRNQLRQLHIDPDTIICDWDGSPLRYDDLSFTIAVLNSGNRYT